MDGHRKSGRISELIQKMASRLAPFQRRFRAECQDVVRAHRVEAWFNGTPWQRPYAREALRLASSWAGKSLPVHDVGCGIAQMIVLLHRAGFRNLAGCDREQNCVSAANALCARFGVQAEIKVADGVSYARSLQPKSAGLVMALNWAYNLDRKQTREFMADVARSLDTARGALVVDIIRSDYKPLPIESREYETSYPNKWTQREFEDCAAAAGLLVQERGPTHAWGRVLYLLRLSSGQ